MEEALPPAAVVILVTGAGGAFAKVLTESGVGTALSETLASTGLPILVLGFVLSLLLRASQGSATVAILTTAGLLAESVAGGDYTTVQVALISLAVAFGALGLSHVNDSGFWVVTRFLGLSVADGLRSWRCSRRSSAPPASCSSACSGQSPARSREARNGRSAGRCWMRPSRACRRAERTATTSWRSTSATPTKSGGRIDAADVHSISLDDIRLGGPQQVAAKLRQVTAGAFVVVNCTDYADLEIVVLGLLEVEDEGKSFLFRTGPSFVRALAGIEPKEPLQTKDIWPDGHPGGHGLVVVGSHVG